MFANFHIFTTVLILSLLLPTQSTLKKIGEDDLSDEVRTLLENRNYVSAAPKLQSLADQGNRQASYFLGQMYVCGKGVEFSCAASAKMFRDSFEGEVASIVDPIWAKSARSELAWLNAACEDKGFKRDEKLALRIATAIAKFDPNPYQLDTLAAAQANTGKYREAVATQIKALEELLLTGKQYGAEEKTMDAFKRRLSLYKARMPARFSRQDATTECNALP